MQALAERLEAAVGGASFESATPIAFSALKTFSPAPESLAGRALASIGRRGKFLILDFGGPRVLVHLSQGGRVDVEDPPKTTRPKFGVVRFRFSGRPSILVKEFGTERKAGWWVLAEGDEGPLAGLGPEPFSDAFAELILTGEDGRRVHTLLRQQSTVAGIGRGYTDDSLHRARVSPYATLALGRAQRRHPGRALRGVGGGAAAHGRPADQGGRPLGGARPPRHPLPHLRRRPAPGVVRVLRGHVLPGVPDGRQGAGRPPDVTPGSLRPPTPRRRRP